MSNLGAGVSDAIINIAKAFSRIAKAHERVADANERVAAAQEALLERSREAGQSTSPAKETPDKAIDYESVRLWLMNAAHGGVPAARKQQREAALLLLDTMFPPSGKEPAR